MAEAMPEGIWQAGNGLINFYAIEEGGKLTVVATGLPGDWGRLRRSLRAHGRSPGDIEAILVTHAHRDHIGGAGRAERESGAAVRIHADDHQYAVGRRFASGPDAPTRGSLPIGRGIPLLAFRVLKNLIAARTLRYAAPAEVVTINDGEVLDVPGRPTVVHTPGHTPGSACFHLPDRGVLFSGDALITLDVAKMRHGPRIAPAGVNFDNEQAIASLAMIEAIQADWILPGHGKAYHGSPADAVAAARRRLGATAPARQAP